jgi:heme A synthase
LWNGAAPAMTNEQWTMENGRMKALQNFRLTAYFIIYEQKVPV